MSAAKAKDTEAAPAVHEEDTPTTARIAAKEASGKALPPLNLTPAERRGLLIVVGVALLQEVHSSVFRWALVGAASAAMVYKSFTRPRQSS
ncbi:hypothetical protein Q4I30_004503 [Leishmania utingensis]|uniref:Uncharacterized protein n=1 Tax=Leishmania utingensis TaxID=653362 RepID=A0AAW3AC86_9TRYP